jgi:hypothetical protein
MCEYRYVPDELNLQTYPELYPEAIGRVPTVVSTLELFINFIAIVPLDARQEPPKYTLPAESQVTEEPSCAEDGLETVIEY